MSPMVRELDLETLRLDGGAHESYEQGVCIMEAVAYVAGEEHTDSPVCASPVITVFLRRWNDDLDAAGRQRLKALIPRVVDSHGDEATEQRRGWMAADWLVRVHTPAWLRLAGLIEQAEALEVLPELDDLTALRASRPAIDAARAKAAAAWAAAGDAARDAAWAAARAAARDAAWAAARDAAWEKLEPTKLSLRDSAYALVERMLEVA